VGTRKRLKLNVIADQLTQTRAALNALAPDLKTENEPRVQAFEQQWQQYLSEGGVVVNKNFGSMGLEVQNNNATSLIIALRLKRQRPKSRRSLASSRKINDCEVGFKGHVNLRSDLIQRATAVRTKFAAYNGELRKINDGMEALKKPPHLLIILRPSALLHHQSFPVPLR